MFVFEYGWDLLMPIIVGYWHDWNVTVYLTATLLLHVKSSEFGNPTVRLAAPTVPEIEAYPSLLDHE